MEEKIKSLNLQLLTSTLFIISIAISLFLTYDEKLETLNKKRIFSEKFDKYLNLFNRIFALGIILTILYINYNEYIQNKEKRINIDPLKHQVYASIFSVISALIVLYVVIENFNENINITSIENPTV